MYFPQVLVRLLIMLKTVTVNKYFLDWLAKHEHKVMENVASKHLKTNGINLSHLNFTLSVFHNLG